MLLQSISLATIARPDPALPALEDVLWEIMITLLTLIGPTNPTPAVVGTIVTMSQVLDGML